MALSQAGSAATAETNAEALRKFRRVRWIKLFPAIPNSLEILTLRGSRPASRFALHTTCPKEEAEKFPALRPDEGKDVARFHLLRPHAGIGLHTPAKVLTAPRCQAGSAGSVP